MEREVMPFDPKLTCELLIRDIPRELRNRFKAYCVLRGTNMNASLKQYMLNCVSGKQRLYEQKVDKAFKAANRRYKGRRKPLPPDLL